MDKQSLITRLARVAALAAAALALTLAPLANPGVAAAKGDFYFDFEESVKPWVADGHGNEGHETLDRGRGDAVCNDVPVNHYAILRAGKVSTTNVGAPEVPLPIGTWTEVSFDSAPGPHLVEISFYARSEDGCEGCIPLVYARGAAPVNIIQFEGLGDGSYLKSYWQEYAYKTIVDIPDQGSTALHVAIGWAGTDAAIGLDCVSIQFRPVP
jgi:hypothetical protein